MRRPVVALLMILALSNLIVHAAHAERCDSIAMTVTASFPNDPGYEGLYRYSIAGNWEILPRALSHLDLFLMVQDCPNICAPGVIGFAAPAGTSTGLDSDENPCGPVHYDGEYLCTGDPSLPDALQTSTIKFEPAAGQPCDSGTVGSGTWFFYSPLAPGASITHSDAVVVKYGQFVCTADLVGPFPTCATAVESRSWGTLKSIYR